MNTKGCKTTATYLLLFSISVLTLIFGWQTHSTTLSLISFAIFGWSGWYLSNKISDLKTVVRRFDERQRRDKKIKDTLRKNK